MTELKGQKMSEKPHTKTLMDAEAKARIMSAEGKKSGGVYDPDSWVARAQSAADKNENADKSGNIGKNGNSGKTLMDAEAKARIMSAEGKKSGGEYEPGGWPARGQSAADKNESSGLVGSKNKT